MKNILLIIAILISSLYSQDDSNENRFTQSTLFKLLFVSKDQHKNDSVPHFCLGVGGFLEPVRGGLNGRIWYNDLIGADLRAYGEWNSHGGGGFFLAGLAKAPVDFPVHPYLTIGGGYHVQKIDTTLSNRPLKEILAFGTFRIAAGGEMRFGPGNRQSLSLEAGYFRGKKEYWRTVSPLGETTAYADTNTFKLKPVSVALLYTYYFCKEQSISDDRDGDGIPDRSDRCKTKPEDKDGYLDEDGCPDLDNDQDGIPDAQDKCPLEAEDEEGFQDEDGCPDYDNDQDGIPDTTDICIDIPEIKNGFEDEDGCPDEAPEEVKKPLILKGVTFESGSDVINPESFPTLNAVAASFIEWSDVDIVIEGHTDNIGSEQANMTLSQKRATAIMNYLISKGIDPSRLTAKGYGETRPIADNKSSTGRAQNRRVELKRKN